MHDPDLAMYKRDYLARTGGTNTLRLQAAVERVQTFVSTVFRERLKRLSPGPGGVYGLGMAIALSGNNVLPEFRKIWPNEWFWPLVGGLLDFLKIQLGIIAGTALAGAAAGGLAGAFLLGVGAVPGGITGAWLGGTAGIWLARFYGLYMAVDYVVENFAQVVPDLKEFYRRAWKAGQSCAPETDHLMASIALARATALMAKLLIEGIVCGILFKGGILTAKGGMKGGRCVYTVLKGEKEAAATINTMFDKLQKARIATYSAPLVTLLRKQMLDCVKVLKGAKPGPGQPETRLVLTVGRRRTASPLPRGARRGQMRVDALGLPLIAGARVGSQLAIDFATKVDKSIEAVLEQGKSSGHTEGPAGPPHEATPGMQTDHITWSGDKRKLTYQGKERTVISQTTEKAGSSGRPRIKTTISLGEGMVQDLFIEDNVVKDVEPPRRPTQEEAPAVKKAEEAERAGGGGGHSEGSLEWLYGLGSDAIAKQLRHAVDHCDSVSVMGRFEGAKTFTFLYKATYGLKEILYTVCLNDRGQVISAKAVATDANGKARPMGLAIGTVMVEKNHPRALKPNHTLLTRQELIDLIKARRQLDFTNKEDYRQLQLPTQ